MRSRHGGARSGLCLLPAADCTRTKMKDERAERSNSKRNGNGRARREQGARDGRPGEEAGDWQAGTAVGIRSWRDVPAVSARRSDFSCRISRA